MKNECENLNEYALSGIGQNKYVLVLGNICRIIEGESKKDALKRYVSNFDFGFNIGNVFEGRIESLDKLKSFKLQTSDLDFNGVKVS